jgi:putative membrane protein
LIFERRPHYNARAPHAPGAFMGDQQSTNPVTPPAPVTWRSAWSAGPGPRTPREAAVLAAKGFAMGTADIIPGVSGGTIAFITGIYGQLLNAITAFDQRFLGRLARFDLKGALAASHLRFLFFLLFGIGTAIVSTARLMHYLMAHHPVPTWSMFMGLIGGSILIVGRQTDLARRTSVVALVAGAVAAWFIVGMIPVSTPEAYWFIFVAGVIAICAMILPGISGSFLLLIMGKYEFITGAVKNPFAPGSLPVLVVFAAGCAVGLLGFSRVLRFALARFEHVTLAALTGLMIGSLRKIWPWKEVLETQVIRGEPRVLRDQNVLPPVFDAEVGLAVGLAVVGFVAVLLLERVARKRGEAEPSTKAVA